MSGCCPQAKLNFPCVRYKPNFGSQLFILQNQKLFVKDVATQQISEYYSLLKDAAEWPN